MKSNILLLCLILISSCSQAQQKKADLMGSYDVTFYDLKVTVDPSQKQLKGSNKIHFEVLQSTQKIQVDLYPNLIIDKIQYKGDNVKYTRDDKAIIIDFGQKLIKGKQDAITIQYHGSPQRNTGRNNGINWKKDKKGRPWIGMTCIEPGARVWYPNKESLSDEPDSARITITAPKTLTCVSNGLLQSITEQDGQKQWTYLTQHPINNYNITFYLGYFVASDLAYTDINGVQRTIKAYCLDYNHHLVPRYFQNLQKIVSFYEKIYGVYPFWDEKMCFVDGGYRGMEHQTCINLTDIGAPSNYPVPLANLIAHELSHEWWGNLVSAKDLADTWLHEGFATYSEALLVEHYQGQEAYNRYIQYCERNVDPSPVVGPRGVRFNSFQTNNIYFKGALVLHQLRKKIGDDKVFFKILKTFLKKYRFKTVMTEDFIKTVNEVTGTDYTAFLNQKLFDK